MGFGDLSVSMQMRDALARLVESSVDRLRPAYRYATVVSIDRAGRKASVIFNGDSGAVQVSMGSIQPIRAGQSVRVEGIGTDKFITDVIGDAYNGVADYNIFDNPYFSDPAKRAKYPMPGGAFYYESNAGTYVRGGHRVVLSTALVTPGSWYPSPPLGIQAVESGARYNYSFMVNRVGATTPALVYFNFVNAAGTVISSVTPAISTALTGSTWVRMAGAFAAPVGAVSMYVSLVHGATVIGSGYWFLSDVVITRFPENLYDVAGTEIIQWADDMSRLGYSSPRRGYIELNGGAYSRTIYAELFANMGTTYGVGDGSTTFNVPNYNGKTLVAFDPADAAFSSITNSGGEKGHILTVPELAAHTHLQNAHDHAYQIKYRLGGAAETNGEAIAGAAAAITTPAGYNASPGQATVATTATNQSTGSGVAHNNLQPYAVVRMAIRASV